MPALRVRARKDLIGAPANAVVASAPPSGSVWGGIRSEADLIGTSLLLVGSRAMLSMPERVAARAAAGARPVPADLDAVREAILRGEDPLGDAFSRLRSGAARRASGAVYTPRPIVAAMTDYLRSEGRVARVVDPGAGSGRFILAAGDAFPDAELVAVETDPVAALMLRANLAVRGLAKRTAVIVQDYREVALPARVGRTAFVGNPPYVRHHDISEAWKGWYAARFAELGIKASALAGLHLHFFLQTRLLAKDGDVGAFITSAEWLDVNYGSALRRLLVDGLGGVAISVLEPTVEAFPGTATTAAITCFRVGEGGGAVRVRSVADLPSLGRMKSGRSVARERLGSHGRWSELVRPGPGAAPGDVELGELFRVHRGQVTGANSIWIAGEQARALPERVKVASVTKARDLLQAGARLASADALRRVIDLPPELDDFTKSERQRIDAFLSWAKREGADQGYIARHRRAWWSVGLREPAPILCTYMARRPPQFTLNAVGARHINIAHGLYPRAPMAPSLLAALVAWLNQNTATASGRTYAGGLTKFEPKEIERLRIPRSLPFLHESARSIIGQDSSYSRQTFVSAVTECPDLPPCTSDWTGC